MTEEKQNKTETTPQPTEDGVTKFENIKKRYENELTEKDKQIKELQEQLHRKDNEVNNTIQNLNQEVNEKLAQAEELKALQANVQELMQDKANALVDKYITEGKLVPAQREKALNLCLSDQDMFIDLYENAPSVVDIKKTVSQKVTGDVSKMVDYFKK